MAIITSGRAYYQSLSLSLTKCKCVWESRQKKGSGRVSFPFFLSLTLKWGESSNFRTNLVDPTSLLNEKQSPHAGTTNTLIYMIIKTIQKILSLQRKMRRGSIYTVCVWRVKSGLQIVIAQSILANKCFGKLSPSPRVRHFFHVKKRSWVRSGPYYCKYANLNTDKELIK